MQPNHRSKEDHPVSKALRDAGFIPLPRLWVLPEAMREIKRITDRYGSTVNAIRAQVNQDENTEEPGLVSEDPVDNREAAWAAFERMRAGL